MLVLKKQSDQNMFLISCFSRCISIEQCSSLSSVPYTNDGMHSAKLGETNILTFVYLGFKQDLLLLFE